MKLTFAGAADTVTGSRHLLDDGGHRLLLDCGLFQGYKSLRLRNRAPFPVPPASIDAVLLSHAHLDHSGYLPALVRDGMRGPIHASAATCALAAVMLRDSARLQEEEAEYANRHRFSKHSPALPLYTVADAERAIAQLRPVPFGQPVALGGNCVATLVPAGHLLGAAVIRLSRGDRSLVYSGDLGRQNDLLMTPPQAPDATDTLLLESTYGNRRHDPVDPLARLGELIRATAARGGIVLMPSFAVGRAQALLLAIHRLRQRGEIPDLPVFLDSPMAVEATGVYRRYRAGLRISAADMRGLTQVARMVTTPAQSRALNDLRHPAVIIASSGMATGGRVLHHMKLLAPDARNLIVFAGYQAGGTRGAHLVEGAREVKIHGQWVPVNAKVESLPGMSAHADRDELLAWLRAMPAPPRQVYLVHGDPDASDALRASIGRELGWPVRVPEHLETVEIPL